MTEHEAKILELEIKSKELIRGSFHINTDSIRAQLMKNREAIRAYKSYLRTLPFKLEYLSQLIRVQAELEVYFNANWEFKLYNPHDTLKLMKVYSSQTYIIVEWHAGQAFHHLYKYNLLFHPDGFLTITSDKPSLPKKQVLQRINEYGKDYNNLYHIESDGTIKFKILNKNFEGKLLHDGIVGKNIKLGEYKDGIVQDQDEIFVLIE